LPFHRALRKYGQENFQFEVVEHCASLEDSSQLTVAGVQYIRRNPDTLSRPELAAKLGVTYTVVRYAQEGRTWKDVSV
jgi:hypothetical protein